MAIKMYCSNCCHGVVDMEKHLKTEEHKRSLKKEAKRYTASTAVRLQKIGG